MQAKFTYDFPHTFTKIIFHDRRDHRHTHVERILSFSQRLFALPPRESDRSLTVSMPLGRTILVNPTPYAISLQIGATCELESNDVPFTGHSTAHTDLRASHRTGRGDLQMGRQKRQTPLWRSPADAARADEVKIKDIPEVDLRVPSDAERRARQDLMLRNFELEREQKKAAAEKDKIEKKKIARHCVLAKKRLEQYQQAGYLYGLDDAGNKVIRSDAARVQATKKLQTTINKNCK